MYSPSVKLGLRSQPSSFGLQSSSKMSQFLQRRESVMNQDEIVSEIKFHYISGETYSLINRDIKLTNRSKNMYLKFYIMCNNPHHYKVFPATGDIPPGKVIDISIQIIGVQQINQMKRNFFAKFASDRFKISWFSHRQSDKVMDEEMSRVKKGSYKILTVSVDYDEEPVHEHEVRKDPAEIEKKVQQSLQIHKKQLSRLEELIKIQEAKRVDETWLYPKCMLFLSIFAFFIGMMIPL